MEKVNVMMNKYETHGFRKHSKVLAWWIFMYIM